MSARRFPTPLRAVLLAAASLILAGPASAVAPCPTDPAALARSTRRDCPRPAPPRLEPYDPDRARAGSRPGFLDLGGGTEVRISGRGRFEGEIRR